MKIDIVGPFPPPHGGVSLHIKRILPFLIAAGYKPKVWNQYAWESADKTVQSTRKPFTLVWWIMYLFRRKAPIVHFHQFSFFHFPYVCLLSWISSNKIFLSMHNENIVKASSFGRRIRVFFLRAARDVTVIAVSGAVKDLLNTMGVKDVVCLPAYVPPVISDKRELPGAAGIKVVFNAWRVRDNNDIATYGVDLLCHLAKRHRGISFYFFIGDVSSSYVESYMRSENIENITIIRGSSLVDYLGDADVFLRLNRQDAYGVSIQEALDLDVPALASNVCRRPRGCVLFENASLPDLFEKFQYLLNTDRKQLVRERATTHYHLDLIQLYKDKTGF